MKPIRLTKRERKQIEEACEGPVDTAPRIEAHSVIEALLFIVAIGGFAYTLFRSGFFS